MVRVNFGLHYSEPFENETVALEELADFIGEQYADLDSEEIQNKLGVEYMFYELGWEFEEIKER